MEKQKRIKLKDRTIENDIKYKGVLSYRHLRIIAWSILVIVQIATIFKINGHFDPVFAANTRWFIIATNVIRDLPLPLLLLANITVILQRKSNWKRLFLFYGGVALLLYVIANFVIFHYGSGLMYAIRGTNDLYQDSLTYGSLLMGLGRSGYVFNFFIDLFLFSLTCYFLYYTPKGGFKSDKHRILFRSLVLLPFLYEISCIIIKSFSIYGFFPMPSFIYFLLPCKPPLLFVAFYLLLLLYRLHETKRVKKNIMDEEKMKEYRKTNAHTFRFSIVLASLFALAAIIGLLLLVIYSIVIYIHKDNAQQLMYFRSLSEHLNIDFSFGLLFMIPISLLFDYKKVHKNNKIDMFVPLVGIGLIIFVYIEGLYQILMANLAEFMEKLKEIVNSFLERNE